MLRRDLLRSSAAVALTGSTGSLVLAHQVTPTLPTKVIPRNEFLAFFGIRNQPSYNTIKEVFKGDFVCAQENIDKLVEIDDGAIHYFIQFFRITCTIKIIKKTGDLTYRPYINGLTDTRNGIPKLVHFSDTKFYSQVLCTNQFDHTSNETPSSIRLSNNKICFDWSLYGITNKLLFDKNAIDYAKENPHLLEELRANFQKVFNHTVELPLWAQPGIPAKPLDWRS